MDLRLHLPPPPLAMLIILCCLRLKNICFFDRGPTFFRFVPSAFIQKGFFYCSSSVCFSFASEMIDNGNLHICYNGKGGLRERERERLERTFVLRTITFVSRLTDCIRLNGNRAESTFISDYSRRQSMCLELAAAISSTIFQ